MNTQLNAQTIIDNYMDLSLTQPSLKLDSFLAAQSYNKKDFQAHFQSLGELEKSVFKVLFEHTLKMLKADSNHASYSAQEKILAFYFTFFEFLSVNRDYIRLSLTQGPFHLRHLPKLNLLKQVYKNYYLEIIEGVYIWPLPFIRDLQKQTLSEIAWLQFLTVLQFWLNDTSAEFEKTDLFIEKSLTAGFEVLQMTQMPALVDYAKFLSQEILKK